MEKKDTDQPDTQQGERNRDMDKPEGEGAVGRGPEDMRSISDEDEDELDEADELEEDEDQEKEV